MFCDEQKFVLERIPKSSHHIQSLDGQPVQDSAVAGQTTVLIQVSSSLQTWTVSLSRTRL
jgi:hypothetical protein